MWEWEWEWEVDGGGRCCVFRRRSDDGCMIWQSRTRALEMEGIQMVSGCLHAVLEVRGSAHSRAECQFCRWRVGNTEGYIKYVIKHMEFSPVKSFWCEFQHHR